MRNLNKTYPAIVISILLLQTLLPTLVRANDCAIKIFGQPIFSINNSDDASIATRVKTIQNNLDSALVAAHDRTPASVNIIYAKGTPIITLGGYQIVSVGTQDASAAHTTPALLAEQWANTIRNALIDQASVKSYVDQLSGHYALSAPPVNTSPSVSTKINSSGNYSGTPSGGDQQHHTAYAPSGLIIPITLKTTISQQTAKDGDPVDGSIRQNINLGDAGIPAGTTVSGEVVVTKEANNSAHHNELQIKFTRLHLVDGQTVAISAHVIGSMNKYASGQRTKTKGGSGVVLGVLGAAAGARCSPTGDALRAAYYTGKGIGKLLSSKNKNVTIPSGTNIQLQLDHPVSISVGISPLDNHNDTPPQK